MSQSFYTTTPIYYVNSIPHLGHAYTSILCDVVKKFHQLKGHQTYMLTGTDEHGDKVMKAAQEKKTTPLELASENSQHFRDLLPVIGVDANDFIRTTEDRHVKVVQDLLQKVYERGDIVFSKYEGKYCYGCERYYGDDELVDGLCPDHKVAPELISEENYFFRMTQYWDRLRQHILDNEDFIVPSSYRKEVLAMLDTQPQDLCISRPKERLTWGIELPFNKKFVTYVWFDALINYISGLEYPDGEKFSNFWPNSHHVIAKDILRPHCVYWPTMLMSMGIKLPKQIAVHGYWLVDEDKMSKSLGNRVDPETYSKEYSSDVLRYFLCRGMRFGKDAHFSHKEFLLICNAELSNNFGNLYSRVAGLIRKNFSSLIPSFSQKDRPAFLQSSLEPVLTEKINGWDTHNYLEEIVLYANKINKYLDDERPWTLKGEEQKEDLGHILRCALEGILHCFYWLTPFTQEVSKKVCAEILGDKKMDSNSFSQLTDHHELPKKVTGFQRIEE